MTNMNKNYCVYIHTNKINHKAYVGMTGLNPNERWGQKGQGYLKKKSNGEYSQPLIARAIIKYGWDNFDHIIFAENLSHDEANHIENILIDLFNLRNPQFGYNVREGGSNGSLSDETISKIKKSKIGTNLSDEHRKHISEAMKNRVMSKEHCKHIGDSLRGKSFTPEHCDKLSKNHADVSGDKNPNFGHKWSEENKKKASTPVIQINKSNNEIINCFYGLSEASEQTGVNVSCICACCGGYQNTAGGYIWKYIYDKQLKDNSVIFGAITLGIITEKEVINVLQTA